MEIKVKLLNGAKAPLRREGDAGFDIFSVEDAYVGPGETVKIPTGLCLELPPGYAGIILPRSSLAIKGRTVISPPIDPSYRGEVHVIAHNLSNSWTWHIMAGERFCQLVIVPFLDACLEVAQELSPSSRASGGFGSTGKF